MSQGDKGPEKPVGLRGKDRRKEGCRARGTLTSSRGDAVSKGTIVSEEEVGPEKAIGPKKTRRPVKWEKGLNSGTLGSEGVIGLLGELGFYVLQWLVCSRCTIRYNQAPS